MIFIDLSKYFQLSLAIWVLTAIIIQGEGVYPHLTKDDIEFLFGRNDVLEHDTIYLKATPRHRRSSPTLIENPGLIDVIMEDSHKRIELEMWPNDNLLSDNFRLVISDDDVTDEIPIFGHGECVYVGHSKDGKQNTLAALSNCDGKGYTGVLIDENATHLIKPIPSKVRRKRDVINDSDDIMEEGLHVINTKSEKRLCALRDMQAMTAPRVFIELEPNFTDNFQWQFQKKNIIENEDIIRLNQSDIDQMHDIDFNEENGLHHIEKRQTERLEIETAVFVDRDMYDFIDEQKPSDTIKEITNIVLSIMNGVYIMYTAPSMKQQIFVKLVILEIMKSGGPNTASGNIELYLNNFCAWQRERKRKDKYNEGWDHGLLLSGLDLYDKVPAADTVIGLAWVGGMCNSKYSCTINEGTSFEAMYVITHEMGHSLGMSHDGTGLNRCPANKHIMSASTGPGKVTWSTCSNVELNSFLKNDSYPTTCLYYEGRESKQIRFKEDLPGSLYDLSRQCSYSLGGNFKPYVLSRDPYNDICREIWCQNRTHAMRTHPAIPGTSCASKKHCIHGQCVEKSTSSNSEPIERDESEDGDTRSNGITTRRPTTTTQRPSSTSDIFRNLLRNIREMFRG